MLARLALGNVRRSARSYTLYFVTLALGVAVFYAFNTVSMQTDFLQGGGSDMLGQIGDIIWGVTVFLAVVMGFLMVYANSFLMRRRKQELGLYQVLGMRRGQVGAILAMETLLVGATSLVVGAGVGVLLSQLLLFATGSLFQVPVTHYRFFFSTDALARTLVCFAVTFVVMLVLNLRTLRRTCLAQLMGAHHEGEQVAVRSLPVSVGLLAIGIALVAWAYVRLTGQGFPGFSEDATATGFLVTCALVVAGTALVFYGLGGTAVSLLRRNHGFWWSGLHAFTTRQLASRINTTCASMTMVSLVLFLALTSVTSGMAICTALNGQADRYAPVDATVAVTSMDTDLSGLDLEAACRDAGVDLASLGQVARVRLHLAGPLAADGATMAGMAQATGASVPSGFENAYPNTLGLWVMGISDLNAQRALLGLDPIDLGEDQYLITCTLDSATSFYDRVLGSGYTFQSGGTTFRPARPSAIDDASAQTENSNNSTNTGTLVVADDVAANLPTVSVVAKVRYAGSADAGNAAFAPLTSGATSTVRASDALQDSVEALAGTTVQVFAATRDMALAVGTGITAMIVYLAIYIGFVLVVACAAIMAVQQLSSTSDSASRYRTLHELGCPDRLAMGSVRTQTAIMFAAPLVVALAHSACALAAVLRLVETFGYANLGQAASLAAAIFLVAYGSYFALTYQAERALVRHAMSRTRRVV